MKCDERIGFSTTKLENIQSNYRQFKRTREFPKRTKEKSDKPTRSSMSTRKSLNSATTQLSKRATSALMSCSTTVKSSQKPAVGALIHLSVTAKQSVSTKTSLLPVLAVMHRPKRPTMFLANIDRKEVTDAGARGGRLRHQRPARGDPPGGPFY